MKKQPLVSKKNPGPKPKVWPPGLVTWQIKHFPPALIDQLKTEAKKHDLTLREYVIIALGTALTKRSPV